MDKPKYLILSERMGIGESLEELEEKTRRIIERQCKMCEKPACYEPDCADCFCSKDEAELERIYLRNVKP